MPLTVTAARKRQAQFGVYPDVFLKDAREKRDGARKLLADGTDPGHHRKARKAAKMTSQANSFEVVAREWHAKFSTGWPPQHAAWVIQRLEPDVFPWSGARPVAEITAPELPVVLRRIEQSRQRQIRGFMILSPMLPQNTA